MDEHRYLILSYPRSGNHLVRGLVEYCFRRPTLGCPGAFRDTPIFARKPNRKSGLISFVSEEPIGFKAHTLNCVWQHTRQEGGPFETLLILRDPVDAISSQLLRFLDSWFLTERRLKKEIANQINWYLQALYHYLQAPPDHRYLIRFEDLVSKERGLQTANDLLRHMGYQGSLTQAEWQEVSALAKASQESLGKVREGRRDRIRAAVGAAISAAEIDAMLAGARGRAA